MFRAFWWWSLFLQCGFDRLCKLIGAGGTASAAVIAAQDPDDFLCVLAFHEFSDGLEIAVAAAVETDVVQLAVFEAEMNLTGTHRPVRGVSVVFNGCYLLSIFWCFCGEYPT